MCISIGRPRYPKQWVLVVVLVYFGSLEGPPFLYTQWFPNKAWIISGDTVHGPAMCKSEQGSSDPGAHAGCGDDRMNQHTPKAHSDPTRRSYITTHGVVRMCSEPGPAVRPQVLWTEKAQQPQCRG